MSVDQPATRRMESILLERRILLWELICQHYTVPKSRQALLDKVIRAGEEIPPKKPVTKKTQVS